MTLNKLYKIIEDRKNKMSKDSYVASLFRKGQDKIIQKVEEEAIEVVVAAKNEGRERIIAEVADLIFHLLIMLVNYRIALKDILQELEKRNRLAEQKKSSYDRRKRR